MSDRASLSRLRPLRVLSAVSVLTLGACSSLPDSGGESRTSEPLIYGANDMVEAYSFNALDLNTVAASIGLLTSAENITYVSHGRGAPETAQVNFKLGSDGQPTTVGADANLCLGEPFSSERYTVPACTAFLLSPGVAATAGHCLDPNHGGLNCDDAEFVLNYRKATSGVPLVINPASDIRGCRRVTRLRNPQNVQNNHVDYAVFDLARPLAKPGLAYSPQSSIVDGTQVMTAGFPLGMLMKGQQVGANVVDARTSTRDYFTTDLDVFKGNSGGPVLQVTADNRLLVAGIVTEGPYPIS